nr:hypothetical protein [Tanacetum cinerariifolium]
MRMEQYLTRTDYDLCEVIINGDSPVPEPPAVGTIVHPKTKAQKLSRKNELKAKSTLLLAIPDEHLLKFHSIKDAKFLGGHGGVGSEMEVIGYSWVQGNTLGMINSETRREDANMKLLRSLPPAWNNIALIMRNKPDIETLSMDDLYNNLKVYEAKIKGQSSSSSNSHNVAFVSSENTSSINETVNAAHDIPTLDLKEQPSASSYADDKMAFCYRMSDTDERRAVSVETPASALVVQDRLGGYDLSYQAKVGPTDFALMAHSSDSANSSNSEVQSCSNECLQSFKNIQKQYDQQKEILNKANLEILAAYDSSVSEIDEDNNQAKDSVNENESIASKSSEEIRQEPKTVRSSAPIIEDWESDSENELVNAAEGKKENAVKSSACWIWRPKGKLVDHTSNDSGSYTLKIFNYVNPNGRLKSVMAWVPKRNEFS